MCGQVLCASTVVYFDQSQWQAATSPTTVSFASAGWTSTFASSPNYDSLTSVSSTITAVSGYSPLGVANNALLGHVSQGVWTDTISKYGSTTFNFADPIYGFGGIFDISGSNGLDIVPGLGPSFATPNGTYDGFVGFVSSQPLDSVLITWGQNGSCQQCFGNSYTLSDFQVQNDPVGTPEPNFKYAFAGLLLLAVCFGVRRHSQRTN
jgi:hypothetical protein